jgi:hypothetical protein
LLIGLELISLSGSPCAEGPLSPYLPPFVMSAA